MSGLIEKLRSWWETADKTQKAVTLFGSAFLLLLLVGTFYFASRPRMEMAYYNLTESQVGTVTAEIQKLGIPVEFDMQGNVSVPSNKVADVRAKLAMAGKAPEGGHLSRPLVEMPPMTPPDVAKINIQRNLEDSLSAAVEKIAGIQKAEVHISPEDKTPFADASKPATASVLLTLAPNGYLNQEQSHSIATMVANSVTGLDPSKVQVLDSNGNTLFDGNSADSPGGRATEKIQAENLEASRRERDLQQSLDRAFGHGSTLVKVNLVLDFDQVHETAVIHPPSEGVSTVQEKSETMTNGSVRPGGDTAFNSNTAPRAAGLPTDKGYEGKSKVVEHPVDTKTTDRTKALGAVQSMAVSVLVNSDKIEDPTPVDQFVGGYLGANGSNPAFTKTVTAVKFDTTAETEAKTAAAQSAGRDRMQQLVSLLPVGALIVVGFLVIRSIGKATRPKTITVAGLPEGSLLALDAEIPDPAEGGSEMDPELAAETLAAHPEILQIEEKVNLPLEQLKKMSMDKPENVAMLIKSWLLEERR